MSVQVTPRVAAPRKHRARRILAAVAAIIVAVIVVPLISLGHYHRTIADSLSRGLGHSVGIGSIHLTLLPLPGLVIHNLVVQEDPAFGAEPLLLAPSVTVYPRLSSLWRQRLEISRIDLDNASVNLVRDSSGRWNFSSLLLQASRTASAPTVQRRPGPTLRFPYIGFSGARINFKQGTEKKAFSLLNADASVWLADPNHWRIRLEAQPARTDLDLDLQDTGTIRLDGSITRAPSLDQLPLDLHAEWSGAQLGQVSRLMLGSDSGWRGDLHAEADFTGDMADLLIRSRMSVADAHRVEFTPINLLSLDARCNATYHHLQQSLENLTCLLPTGDGHLLLTGWIPNLPHPQPNLSLEINHTPVAFAVTLLGLLRSSLPSLVNASGTINGRFDWAPPSAIQIPTGAPHVAQMPQVSRAPQVSLLKPGNDTEILTGHAIADNVSVYFSGVDRPFTFAALRFSTPAAPSESGSISGHGLSHAGKPAKFKGAFAPEARSSSSSSSSVEGHVSSPNTILLEPATLVAGAPRPMQVSGEFSRSGFKLQFTGEAALAWLQPLASDFVQLQPLRRLALKGTVQPDLTFSAPWVPGLDPNTGSDFHAAMEGGIRIEHAQFRPSWLREPIDVSTATAQFANGVVSWENAHISVNGIAAEGSATWPIVCGEPAGCPAQINLDFPTLNAAALQSTLLGAGRHNEFLQAILSSIESPVSPWPALDGTIRSGILSIGTLKLHNATASISVRGHRLNLLSLNATALGGTVRASGSIQPDSGGPRYALDISASGIKLARAGGLFPENGRSENWGTGSIDGHAALKLHGYSGLASSAAGTFAWTVHGPWGGSWNGSEDGTGSESAPFFLNAAQPLASKHREWGSQWAAAGTIRHETLTLTSGPARGTISFSRKLNLEWTQAPAGAPRPEAKHEAVRQAPLRITGTLARPAIAGNSGGSSADTTNPANPRN